MVPSDRILAVKKWVPMMESPPPNNHLLVQFDTLVFENNAEYRLYFHEKLFDKEFSLHVSKSRVNGMYDRHTDH